MEKRSRNTLIIIIIIITAVATHPARRPASWGQHWDWLIRCQYTVAG